MAWKLLYGAENNVHLEQTFGTNVWLLFEENVSENIIYKMADI